MDCGGDAMITVKRESELEAQAWIFTYIPSEHSLSLFRWERDARKTPRGRMKPGGTWYRGDRGAKPDVPHDVLDEARRQFVETLRVEG
jgi:hypothetical protein